MEKELINTWDYYGFVDGSWKTNNGVIMAGIGGHLKTKENDIQYLFSRPTKADNPLHAETKDLVHMLQEIRQNINNDKRVVVYTDSFELWHSIQLYKAGHILYIPYA